MSVVALEVVVDEGEGNVHECDPGHAVDGDDDGAWRRKRCVCEGGSERGHMFMCVWMWVYVELGV